VIGILNADDVYEHVEVIKNIVAKFQEKNSDAVYADLKYVMKNDLNKVIRYWKSGKYRDGKFLYGWMPPHPTFFVKKDAYNKLGLYRTDLKSASDYELMLRFIHVNKINIDYLPEVIIRMREGGVSNHSIKNRLNANKEDRKAWELNNIKPGPFTLILKPLSKLFQFIVKE
jgi:glycosyltransferase